MLTLAFMAGLRPKLHATRRPVGSKHLGQMAVRHAQGGMALVGASALSGAGSSECVRPGCLLVSGDE